MNQIAIANDELIKLGYQPKLHRSLTLWQLTSFGLTYLQPIGPAVIFGFLLTTSGGTVALPYLFAFIGMIFTILSYSVLIKEYPLSGSIYNYVKLIVGPFWGFMAGWLLALDYVLIPTITSVSAAIYAHQLVPMISFEVWLITFVLSMGFLNIIGIRSASYFSSLILFIQISIVLLGFGLWIYFIVNSHHSIFALFSTKPFHFTSAMNLVQASSLAIFSFLGFDAITTLAEESVNPRRDIPRAMMICASIGFVIMFLTGYLGVLIVPNWQSLISDTDWVNTVLFRVSKQAGGDVFGVLYAVGFILAMVVCNLVGTTAGSRLLYSMGRDGVISQRVFARINNKWKTPYASIIFIMIVELLFGTLISQDQLAELINYGAISGFILLNCSVVWLGYKYSRKNVSLKFIYLKFYILPLCALIIMFAIFACMKPITLIFGMLWSLIGVICFLLSCKWLPVS